MGSSDVDISGGGLSVSRGVGLQARHPRPRCAAAMWQVGPGLRGYTYSVCHLESIIAEDTCSLNTGLQYTPSPAAPHAHTHTHSFPVMCSE